MMKKLLLITFLTLFSTTLITAQNLPTNPSPGKCYVKCNKYRAKLNLGFNYPAKLISFAVVNLWLFVLHVQQNLWFWRHI